MKKIFFALVAVSSVCLAYIPTVNFVFDRVAELHGKGNYRISMELTFREGADTQVVKEYWIVADNGDMFVQANGGVFKTTKVLKRSRLYWFDGGEKVSDVTADHFMPVLFNRSSLDLRRMFVRWGVIPPDSLKEKKAPKELTEIKNETEPFVRLGRVNGAVQYAYGEADKPGVWIEQDHFFISKMRMPSGAVFSGKDYLVYAKNLAFPKAQTVQFGNKEVEIKVTGLSATESLGKEEKLKLEPTYLRGKADYTTTWPTSSLAPTLQEFYKRFR